MGCRQSLGCRKRPREARHLGFDLALEGAGVTHILPGIQIIMESVAGTQGIHVWKCECMMECVCSQACGRACALCVHHECEYMHMIIYACTYTIVSETEDAPVFMCTHRYMC